RKVADSVEYRPPMIYEHFANKEAILRELMREGFQLLLTEIRTTVAVAADPADRMIGIACAYWEFAWNYPELYQVMHGLDGVPFCSEDASGAPGGKLAEAEAVFEAAKQIVR